MYIVSLFDRCAQITESILAGPRSGSAPPPPHAPVRPDHEGAAAQADDWAEDGNSPPQPPSDDRPK